MSRLPSIQITLIDPLREPEGLRHYKPVLTASENQKGVLDVDTVKGCTLGMKVRPDGGCYHECYAAKTAARYGIDFGVSVSRKLTPWNRGEVFRAVRDFPASWYRIGTAGDPCHDWDNTLEVCEALHGTLKQAVIITKHWVKLTDSHLTRLKALGAVVNTSVSALDTAQELKHRLKQIERIKLAGVHSVPRVVTCDWADTELGRKGRKTQDKLLALEHVIDNPLRATKSNALVQSGDILLHSHPEAVGGGKSISLHDTRVYLGTCNNCPDQCGSTIPSNYNAIGDTKMAKQDNLFTESLEWDYAETIIGSGYEDDISKLAIEDGIAKRAARKNMQIHSAIILKLNGDFSGFFTFQNNHVSQEFCLLQSVIKPEKYNKELYAEMVRQVIARNTSGYPAIITTDPKSKFETPKLFESVGFQTYLKMSGFHYMVHGSLASVRMKLLAHITMCNVWSSIKGDWLRLKKEWKERIEGAGIATGVPNPAFATREGCWQGAAGFSNVVLQKRTIENGKVKEDKEKSHNGNASVLDPVACEVIARFFMPTEGTRVYNPFGGGVQFGYVAGACGFEYVASEIRQNQCDANNKLCSEFDNVKWIQSDSSTYEPEGKFDLVFSCPPYYRVERYLDYDGKPPEGEINSLDTYEKFRDVLFAGYKKAIAALNDDCFFVVMTGDSRDKNGAYYCSESETELFFKENGLSVYNKIIYLECEFTRLAQAKKTLNTRKFPKREQKIIVAYKGDMTKIKDRFAPVGRL